MSIVSRYNDFLDPGLYLAILLAQVGYADFHGFGFGGEVPVADLVADPIDVSLVGEGDGDGVVGPGDLLLRN